MNIYNKSPVTITVDLKKHRIRIFKTTLVLLGSPKYIQLLVNPDSMMLAIKGVESKSRDVHRVNFSVLQPDNSYELYSTHLMSKLGALIEDLDYNYSYRISGHFIEEENMVVFSLKTIQRIDPWEIK